MSTPPPKRDARFYQNLYRDRIDFCELGRQDPALAAVLNNGQLDFYDAQAVRQLTKTLMQRDFGLAVELPDDRLCPPVPIRHSYIRWLWALLGGEEEEGDSRRAVVGLDIGTGASCVYPLLGCAQCPDWRFVATDIDAKSLDWARANVARNAEELGRGRITVLARHAHDPLLPRLPASDETAYTFVMTNPPFYASADEMAATAAAKKRPPHAVCTGAAVEMVTPGGEVAFVRRLLEESLAVHESRAPSSPHDTWYTAMLGRLSSLAAIVEQLRARGIDNYAVATFVPGPTDGRAEEAKQHAPSKTRRWAIGWSFGSRRPVSEAAHAGLSRVESSRDGGVGISALRPLLPAPTEANVWSMSSSSASTSLPLLGAALDSAMHALELDSWSWDEGRLRGAGRASENVWGRAWRRRKQREQREQRELRGQEEQSTGQGGTRPDCTGSPSAQAALGFLVSIQVGLKQTTVHCRWTEGHSEPLFQSFCGFLRVKLKESGLGQ